jgi:Mrp family chromosome partitioning ATPase
MQYVLEELGGRSRRRLVVFDSSPLLAVSESLVLVSHMGQVVVVVAAGRTHRSALGSALEGMSDSQYVGLILNMSRLPASENHYDRYYGRYGRAIEGEA